MPDRYEELYYHLVWVTKDRAPYLSEHIAKRLLDYTNLLCDEMQIVVVAVNCMPDHVHLACSTPTKHSVAGVMKALKGKSANYINHTGQQNDFLAWQPGYGVLTISKSHVKVIARYVECQQLHHEAGTTQPKLERTQPPDTEGSP